MKKVIDYINEVKFGALFHANKKYENEIDKPVYKNTRSNKIYVKIDTFDEFIKAHKCAGKDITNKLEKYETIKNYLAKDKDTFILLCPDKDDNNKIAIYEQSPTEGYLQKYYIKLGKCNIVKNFTYEYWKKEKWVIK